MIKFEDMKDTGVTKETFDKYSPLLEIELNYLTFNRYKNYTLNEEIKKTLISAYLSCFHSFENMEKDLGYKGIASESVSNHSVSYKQKEDTLEVDMYKVANSILYRAVLPLGWCYRGVL